jgi:hypothetical protein
MTNNTHVRQEPIARRTSGDDVRPECIDFKVYKLFKVNT